MNRFDAYYPRDTAPERDGDGGFVGVDERLDPDQLPSGLVASATNARFRHGTIETRPGITILPWMKADGRTPFTTTDAYHLFKVSPPNAYRDYVGGTGVFIPTGTDNNAIIGLRLGEERTIQSVQITLNGAPANWSTSNAAAFPVGILQNGVVQNTDYTANVNVTGQEFLFAINCSTISDVLVNSYITVTVVFSSGTGVSQSISFGP